MLAGVHVSPCLSKVMVQWSYAYICIYIHVCTYIVIVIRVTGDPGETGETPYPILTSQPR